MPNEIVKTREPFQDAAENPATDVAKAGLVGAAKRRELIAADEERIGKALRTPEYKEGTAIAYTYDARVSPDSFEWEPGEWESGEYVVKPWYGMSTELATGEKAYDIDMYGLVKSLTRKRFTAKTRRDIEAAAPETLQIVGLENGLVIVNPYDLQGWMKQAGVVDKDDDILPIKVLRTPPLKAETPNESDFPSRKNDNWEEIIDRLFIESDTIAEGILNHSDEGTPRGTIRELSNEEVVALAEDDERMSNLKSIRDQWQDACIVETESLIGDKTKYVALLLPEQEADGSIKVWAIAENPAVGNALFIVDPYRLPEGTSWKDVLIDTTKKTAVMRGALKKVHTPDGKWQDRLLEIITAPR